MMDWRIFLVKIIFLLTFLALIGRLGQIMLLRHKDYQALAQRQHFLEVVLPARRGTIYSADGFALASDEEAYLVWANPSEINQSEGIPKGGLSREQAKTLAEKLTPVLFPYSLRALNLEKDAESQNQEQALSKAQDGYQEDLIDLLSRKDALYVPLAHKVSVETRDQIKGLNLPGIHFELEPKRAYPEGGLAAYVLGFVGKNSVGLNQGYFGVEGYYNGDLSGRPGKIVFERDAVGKPIPVGQLKRIEPENGRDLVLTLRRELQYLIEKKLAEGVRKYSAESGEVILLDPRSGAIWAMAGYPSYDPENWVVELKDNNDVSKVEIFRNRAIANVYEPGSVLKPFTIASALDAGVVTPATTYQDEGPVEYSGHWVRTWDNKYHGEINLARILQLSNNTGAAWVGHQLGYDGFARYLKRFHLGEKTGVDLQGEASGIVRPRDEWRDIDLATMSFGQGISVTPLQVALIFSAIANDGVMMRPRVVREIHSFVSPGNRNPHAAKVIQIESQEIGQPISAETAQKMRIMLKSVVEKSSIAWYVKQAGLHKFSIAGKTGTAQIPVNGKYDPNKTNATFVGFAPAEDPRFVMLVHLSKPSTSTFSIATALPLWLEIAKELFLYFGIAPS